MEFYAPSSNQLTVKTDLEFRKYKIRHPQFEKIWLVNFPITEGYNIVVGSVWMILIVCQGSLTCLASIEMIYSFPLIVLK